MKTDEKLTKITEDLKFLTANTTSVMDRTNNSKLSPEQNDLSNPTDPTAVFPANTRASPLDEGKSNKIGGMRTLKHETTLPKVYELLIKTELKGDTDVNFKNFYNHIKI